MPVSTLSPTSTQSPVSTLLRASTLTSAGALSPAGVLSPGLTPVSGPIRTAAPTSERRSRFVALIGALSILVALLLGALALPAAAATSGGVGSGVGVPQTQHNTASRPSGSTGALVFGAICLAGIVATGGGVLWYTVRTRRSLD